MGFKTLKISSKMNAYLRSIMNIKASVFNSSLFATLYSFSDSRFFTDFNDFHLIRGVIGGK